MCHQCNDDHARGTARHQAERRTVLAGGVGLAMSILTPAASASTPRAVGGRVGAEAAQGRIPARGLAVTQAKGRFQPYAFTRRPVGDDDILIDILYAGICHSDVHKVRDDWAKEQYPIVPGHEIAGRVVQVGRNVSKFKVGDHAGVGVWIGSCGRCEFCKTQMEHLCAQRVTSFAGVDPFHGNDVNRGGYSNNYVVSQDFAVRIPEGAEMDKVAPLLCAGITAYTPVVFSNVQRGDKVGVAGFGGLGHMALQYALARGADVTVFDIVEDKRGDALAMGASRFVNVAHGNELQGLNNRFDLIVNSIPAGHDPQMYLKMLRIGGEMAVLGLPPTAEVPAIPTSSLTKTALVKIYGSDTGSISQLQQMMDYSVGNGIYPKVQVIPVSRIDEAYQGVLAGAVKFRYVIDMKTLA